MELESSEGIIELKPTKTEDADIDNGLENNLTLKTRIRHNKFKDENMDTGEQKIFNIPYLKQEIKTEELDTPYLQQNSVLCDTKEYFYDETNCCKEEGNKDKHASILVSTDENKLLIKKDIDEEDDCISLQYINKHPCSTDTIKAVEERKADRDVELQKQDSTTPNIENGRTQPGELCNLITNKPFGCERCDYSTNYKFRLVRHMLIHGEGDNGLFSCANCSYSTNCKNELVDHMSLHCKEKRLTLSCNVCNYKTRCETNLRKHTLNVHSEVYIMHPCMYCEKSFKSKTLLIRHTLIHEGNKLFSCAKCKYSTNYKSHLIDHMSLHYKGKERRFICENCNYKTHCINYLKKHTLYVHSMVYKKHSCTSCVKNFKSKRALDEHIIKNHQTSVDLVSSKVHKCATCNFETTKKCNLTRHVALHHPETNENSYKCIHCTYATCNKTNYTKHLDAHKKLKQNICDSCLKCFTRKQCLDNHILSHHGDDVQLMQRVTYKIHSCEQCPYKTVYAVNIKRHVDGKHKL